MRKTPSERMYLSAQWFMRPETMAAFSARFSRFLDALGTTHPLFGAWYEQASSRAVATSAPRIDPSAPSEIESLILKSFRNYGPEPKSRISVGLWNGHEGVEGSTITIHADISGHDSKVRSTVNLDLPFTSTFRELLVKSGLGMDLIHLAARAWEPDCAVITSDELRRLLYPSSLPKLQVGWFTFLPCGFGPPPLLPPGYVLVDINGLGCLIGIESFDLYTASSDVQVNAVQFLSKTLRKRESTG